VDEVELGEGGDADCLDSDHEQEGRDPCATAGNPYAAEGIGDAETSTLEDEAEGDSDGKTGEDHGVCSIRAFRHHPR